MSHNSVEQTEINGKQVRLIPYEYFAFIKEISYSSSEPVELQLRYPIFISFMRYARSFHNFLRNKHKKNSQTPVSIQASRSNELEYVSRDEHPISRKQISTNALKVLYRLHRNGYEAHLVGGAVRDLLLGKFPKDFDVATSASPEEVQTLFRNCRIIGRRFRLVHILFGREVIEVATFRGHPQSLEGALEHIKTHSTEAGFLVRDNLYGTIEEDAERRDFTINSLYYSIADFAIRDYVGGLDDLKRKTLRLIGDPSTRYREDPVRMLRAIRFAAQLNMSLSPNTSDSIPELATLLSNVASARLFEETLKLFQTGMGALTYPLLKTYGLLEVLFPAIGPLFLDPHWNKKTNTLIERLVHNTDERIHAKKRVSPSFLFAAFLWSPVAKASTGDGGPTTHPFLSKNFVNCFEKILMNQCTITAIPKRHTLSVRDIWLLQKHFLSTKKNATFLSGIVNHPKFRAGLDLLELRGTVEGPEVRKLWAFWNKQYLQQQGAGIETDTTISVSKPESPDPVPKKRRRRRPRRPVAPTPTLYEEEASNAPKVIP